MGRKHRYIKNKERDCTQYIMNNTHLLYSAKSAFGAALLVVALGMSTFFAFEPSVSRSATTSFTVTQQVTGDISVTVNNSAVTMVGTVSGLTGGYATGTTQAVVLTNNATGYYLTLAFSSTTAMKLNGASSTINNYSQAGADPDFAWQDNASGGAGEFGYNVSASSSADLDQSFKNDTSNCNAGSNMTADRCWATPSNVAEQIAFTSAPTPAGGSTTTIKFKVAVPNAPSPSLPSGFYVATGTLTALTNP
jgi:hypothetical protein